MEQRSLTAAGNEQIPYLSGIFPIHFGFSASKILCVFRELGLISFCGALISTLIVSKNSVGLSASRRCTAESVARLLPICSSLHSTLERPLRTVRNLIALESWRKGPTYRAKPIAGIAGPHSVQIGRTFGMSDMFAREASERRGRLFFMLS